MADNSGSGILATYTFFQMVYLNAHESLRWAVGGVGGVALPDIVVIITKLNLSHLNPAILLVERLGNKTIISS